MWPSLHQILLLGYATIHCNGYLATQDSRHLFGRRAEISSVCYTYVTSYPVLASDEKYITITRKYTGTITWTRTIGGTGDNPGVVVIQDPSANDGSGSPGDPGGSSEPLTIPPSKGDNSYAIVIQSYTGTGVNTNTAPSTSVVPPSGTSPGTIYVIAPAGSAAGGSDGPDGQPFTLQPMDPTGYATIFKPYDGTATGTTPIRITVPPSGTRPGSVIIQTPPPGRDPGNFQQGQAFTITPASEGGYYTVFQPNPGTGTAPVMITVPPSGTISGTMIIQTPTPTKGGQGGVTLQPTESGGFVTIIEAAVPGALTSPVLVTLQPTGTEPGTVLIQTPGPSIANNAPNLNPTITLLPTESGGYVTIFKPAEGTVTVTVPVRITIRPSGTDPGTVIVETPPHLPASRPVPGNSLGSDGSPPAVGPVNLDGTPIGGPATLGETRDGGPVEPESYVTVIRTDAPQGIGGHITMPVTVTIPPTGTEPAAIFIIFPAEPTGDFQGPGKLTAHNSSATGSVRTTGSLSEGMLSNTKNGNPWATGSQSGANFGTNRTSQATGSQSGVNSGTNITFQATGSQPGVNPGTNITFQATGSQSGVNSGTNITFQATGSQSGVNPGTNITSQATGSQPGVNSGTNIASQATGSQSGVNPGTNITSQATGSQPGVNPGTNIASQATGSQSGVNSSTNRNPQGTHRASGIGSATKGGPSPSGNPTGNTTRSSAATNGSDQHTLTDISKTGGADSPASTGYPSTTGGNANPTNGGNSNPSNTSGGSAGGTAALASEKGSPSSSVAPSDSASTAAPTDLEVGLLIKSGTATGTGSGSGTTLSTDDGTGTLAGLPVDMTGAPPVSSAISADASKTAESPSSKIEEDHSDMDEAGGSRTSDQSNMSDGAGGSRTMEEDSNTSESASMFRADASKTTTHPSSKTREDDSGNTEKSATGTDDGPNNAHVHNNGTSQSQRAPSGARPTLGLPFDAADNDATSTTSFRNRYRSWGAGCHPRTGPGFDFYGRVVDVN
ncbi:Fc.00g031850.m01.CDS01 [Cosmosporella sp. VM-42]